MRMIAMAVAAAALFVAPLAASADTLPITDISSQAAITVDPGGVGVRVGHDRFDSRRRDRRVHDRFESRNRDRVTVRGRRDCRTETTRTETPRGVKIVKKKVCD